MYQWAKSRAGADESNVVLRTLVSLYFILILGSKYGGLQGKVSEMDLNELKSMIADILLPKASPRS